MNARALVVVQRLALLAALLASAALIIDYQNIGDPTFCGAESSCFKVRASEVGRELASWTSKVGLSVPHVGVVAHVALLALSLVSRTRRMIRLTAGVALVGGVAALGLLGAQVSIGEACPWCVIVDVAALVVAASSALLARADAAEAPAWAREAAASNVVLAWAVGAATIVALPFVWARNAETAPLPASIAALQEPGKLTVVSFTDFECPYCRSLAPALAGIKANPRVAFKRRMAPLEFHAGAEPAALGYLCVAEERKEAMAAALYAASPGMLRDKGIAELAVKAGEPDLAAFLGCMRSEETKKQLAAEIEAFQSAGGTGLPTTWIGRRVVKGFRPEQIARALDAELSGAGLSLPVWAMFAVAAAVGAAIGALHVRGARAAAAAAPDGGRGEGAPARKGRAGAPDGEGGDAAAPEDGGAKPARRAARTAAATPAAKRESGGAEPPPEDGEDT